jgi:hypothetical protein
MIAAIVRFLSEKRNAFKPIGPMRSCSRPTDWVTIGSFKMAKFLLRLLNSYQADRGLMADLTANMLRAK